MGFELGPADDLVGVGHVSSGSARVWLRTREPGRHRLELWPKARHDDVQTLTFEVPANPATDHTHAVQYPEDFGGEPLKPGARYGVRVLRDGDGQTLGGGSFETAPAKIDDTPDRFALAVMSCNQPFDADGHINERAQRTLRALPAAFEELGVKRVIMLGDQMYADYPKPLSLFDEDYFRTVAPNGQRSIFDCSREQVRHLYQDRYRVFWNVPGMREVQARFPCYLVPDDHEFFDNFGSAPQHRTGAHEPVAEGALDAAFDYEGLRVKPRDGGRQPMYASFEYGPLAVFVMDLRSQRRADAERVEVYGDDQLDALSTYLQAQRERPVVVIGISVPLIHVPRSLASIGAALLGQSSDLADRWTYEKAARSYERLCRLLYEHQRAQPEQRVVLVSGDIHIGVVSRLSWLASGERCYQLVTSPVSHVEGRPFRVIAGLLPLLANGHTFNRGELACKMELLEGAPNKNPYSGLNVGLVELARRERRWELRLSLLSHAARGAGYRRVFRSAKL